MCEVKLQFKQHACYRNGQKFLYLLALRDIYLCIDSALLKYDVYMRNLKGMGFEINTYDRCVANKITDQKQCTLVWYVDDNKLSHKYPKVVTEKLEALKKHLG